MAEESTPLYEKLIYEDEVKCIQLKVVVNEFKGVFYIHIRKYFLSYEGEWVPSTEGVSMPLTIENSMSLTDALLDICSQAEGDELLRKHFVEKLKCQSE